jgi:coenzyme F420-0:L-glutamate ligase / coenzyme F420-1:gamma-L-glutamate ligase
VPVTSINIRGLEGIPEIRPGDDLGGIIIAALRRCKERLETRGASWRPVFVVAQKAVSKAEGRIVQLATIEPGERACSLATELHRDPRIVEVVLRESRRIVRAGHGVLIVETHGGFVCANAGVDASNAPEGCVILLPLDPDGSAARLRSELCAALYMDVGVIISDTFGRPWRQGLTNVALGVSGLSPFVDYRGQVDWYGRPLHATVLAAADELAGAAELVMGKASGIPVALIEGFVCETGSGSGKEMIRPAAEDLFR